MFGNLTEIISLLQNKQKLATRIKEEVPPLVRQLHAAIAAQCGADPETPTAVVLFPWNTDAGITTMARVHRVNEFGDLGEDLGTIDLNVAVQGIPTEVITSILPF